MASEHDTCGPKVNDEKVVNTTRHTVNDSHQTKSEEKLATGATVGIQANDYEIDRPSGRLPARRRLIPYKFRDYRNPDHAEDDEDDPDYVIENRSRRPIGRPKKKVTSSSDDNTGTETIKLVEETPPVDGKSFEILQKVPKNSQGGTVCPYCGKRFMQKGNLKAHLRMHTGEKPFICDVEGCGNSYRANESLRRHKLTHMGVKPYECEVCQNRFSSSKSLQEHLNRHTDTKPYACCTCGLCFRQASCLRRHLLTHSNELRYTCEVCGRGFNQAVYLRSHMKVHTGARPFRCDVCDKMFKHASDLSRHKRIHTGEKPYHCVHCAAAFSDASSRNRHQREHDGSLPYACQFCSERFKRSGKLRSHLRLKHGEKYNANLKEESEVLVFYSDTGVDQKNMSGDIVNRFSKQFIFTQKEDSVQNNADAENGVNKNCQEDSAASVEQSSNLTKHPPSVNEGGVDKVGLQFNSNATANAIPLEIPLECLQGNPDETTVVAITGVAEGHDGKTVDPEALEYTYHILEEQMEENQVVEVHIGVENLKDLTGSNDQVTAVESPKTTMDFVANPDFGSQDYYNWLSSFTELCKMVPMPLDTSLFQKISQVHKTLSDVMAMPYGVIAEKANFKILMSISKELNCIINEHLSYVLENLDKNNSDAS